MENVELKYETKDLKCIVFDYKKEFDDYGEKSFVEVFFKYNINVLENMLIFNLIFIFKNIENIEYLKVEVSEKITFDSPNFKKIYTKEKNQVFLNKVLLQHRCKILLENVKGQISMFNFLNNQNIKTLHVDFNEIVKNDFIIDLNNQE